MILTKSYLRAAYYIRKAWKHFDEAYDQSRKIQVDKRVEGLVAFGVGFFQFGISMVPPQLYVI
jgi:hypothetical protein